MNFNNKLYNELIALLEDAEKGIILQTLTILYKKYSKKPELFTEDYREKLINALYKAQESPDIFIGVKPTDSAEIIVGRQIAAVKLFFYCLYPS